MAENTFKILQCEHRKIFKVYLAIFQRYERKRQDIFANHLKNSHQIAEFLWIGRMAIPHSQLYMLAWICIMILSEKFHGI